MATNFDEILNSLHTLAALTDEDEIIEITSRRAFKVPSEYNLVLGYAGDVNSQIVTFGLPYKHEGHSLINCATKKLRWKNLTSGAEGVSDLNVAKEDSPLYWLATWEVPAEAMTMAGSVEIGVSISDFSKDNPTKIAFSWNTPSFKGFSVGNTFSEVSEVLMEGGISLLPSKDEILVVDINSRNIVAPPKWNPILCSYGDIGVSNLFFEINRYIQGYDLLNLDSGTTVEVGYSFGNKDVEYNGAITISQFLDSLESQKSNKVLLIWNVPPEITNNASFYTGSIAISLRIQTKSGDDVTKRWSTLSFNKLSIGSSVALNDLVNHIQRDEDMLTRMVEEEVSEVIDDKIDGYMDNTYFVTTDN